MSPQRTSQNRPRTLIVLVSGWESVAAHETWIASETNQSVMRVLNEMVTIEEFRHLDIDPEGFPGDDAEELEVKIFTLPSDSSEEVESGEARTSFMKNVESKSDFREGEKSKIGWDVDTAAQVVVALRVVASNTHEAAIKEDVPRASIFRTKARRVL